MSTNNPVPQKPIYQSALQARKAAAAANNQLSTINPIETNPSLAKERIGIVFDDSGSMNGQAIKDAHSGVEEFLRSCKKDETAVAIYPMNATFLELCANLPALAILVSKIEATGGTPMYTRVIDMLERENLTRGIIFSDGQPTDEYKANEFFALATEKSIPIDTVYIAPKFTSEDDLAGKLLKEIADRTGGIFLKFENGKSNFSTAFKYLAPTYRAMLADKSFYDKIQGR